MPLFQQSVQKKFIKDLDKAKVEMAYQKLVAHFGNADVQDNIRKQKKSNIKKAFWTLCLWMYWATRSIRNRILTS